MSHELSVKVDQSVPSKFDRFTTVSLSVESNGVSIDLNPLLPDLWTIVQAPNARVHTDPERKRVVIPTDYFKFPGSMFSFLHEIGHAHADEYKAEDEIEEELLLRDKYVHLGPEVFTPQDKLRFQELVIVSEKAAWRWAIRTIRACRSRGVDLEPSLSNRDLNRIAKQKLATYTV